MCNRALGHAQAGMRIQVCTNVRNRSMHDVWSAIHVTGPILIFTSSQLTQEVQRPLAELGELRHLRRLGVRPLLHGLLPRRLALGPRLRLREGTLDVGTQPVASVDECGDGVSRQRAEKQCLDEVFRLGGERSAILECGETKIRVLLLGFFSSFIQPNFNFKIAT